MIALSAPLSARSAILLALAVLIAHEPVHRAERQYCGCEANDGEGLDLSRIQDNELPSYGVSSIEPNG